MSEVFAYADPPYVGQAKRHYGEEEVDHRVLIDWLTTNFPGGWALSCTSSSLQELLPLCPPGVRIGAWVKPFHAYKRGVRPAYAWEPLIYRGGRNPMNGYPAAIPEKGGPALTPKDFVSANITLKRGLVGAKPMTVARWVLDLLNAQPGDTFVDVFPGTGGVGAVARELGLEVIEGGFLCD